MRSSLGTRERSDCLRHRCTWSSRRRPYWTLKDYPDTAGQMGRMDDYEAFLTDLGKVWERCYDALVPGGRLVCVVGDVCLSRRRNAGRHAVIPLHAAIQTQCTAIGFDNLAPIIWHKIANMKTEASRRRVVSRQAVRAERCHQERYRVHPDAAKARRISQPESGGSPLEPDPCGRS